MKCHTILLFILQISLINAEINQLIKTAVTVANSVYKHQYITSIVCTENNTDHVSAFLNNFRGSVMVNSMKNISNYKINLGQINGYNQTVFIAASMNEFEKIIANLSVQLKIPIYLILVLTYFIRKESQLSKIAKIAWQNNLADIIIISSHKSGNVTLSTYIPYTEGSCEDYKPVQLIDTANLFPNKFKNFHLCPIKATFIQFKPYLDLKFENGTITSIGGINGDALMLLVKILNSTVDVISSSDHGGYGTYINGSGTGSFGDLLYRGADILLPAGIVNQRRYSVSHLTYIYHDLGLYWCGPKRRVIYHWAKIFVPLFSDITPFLCLSFAVFVLITILVRKYKVHKSESRDGIFFQSFVIFLGQGVRFMTTSSMINSLYVLWIWFCFILRNVYQGDLINDLKKDILEKPFGQIEEAINEVDGFGGGEVLLEFFKGTPLENKYTVLQVAEISKYLKEIAKGKRFMLLTDIVLIRSYNHALQVLEKPMSRAPQCFYMRPRWPAAKQVDATIQRIAEAGFLENIINTNIRKLNKQRESDMEVSPLHMSTLSACFYGLAVMWLISIILFVLEIVYYKLKRN